jgi:hypothetical protein
VITDRFPASEWGVFAMARSGKGGKVVLDWTEVA